MQYWNLHTRSSWYRQRLENKDQIFLCDVIVLDFFPKGTGKKEFMYTFMQEANIGWSQSVSVVEKSWTVTRYQPVCLNSDEENLFTTQMITYILMRKDRCSSTSVFANEGLIAQHIEINTGI